MTTESPAITPPLFDLFWEEYRQKILLALGVILLLTLGAAGILLLRHTRRVASETLLAQSSDITSWTKVITSYPSSMAAADAMLLLAAAQRQADHLEQANATYAQFLKKFPHHPLAVSAMIGRALNEDLAEHPDQALDQLQQASVAYPQSYGAPFALWMRARLLTRLGKTEEAKKMLQMITSQYPDSFINRILLRQPTLH
jgi:tetratricopeptide (TPR) repeat protein